MNLALLTAILGLFAATPTLGDNDPCRGLESDKIAKELCLCRQIESDLQRLNCFDRQTLTQIALRAQARALAQWLSERPYGIEAMRELLRSEND